MLAESNSGERMGTFRDTRTDVDANTASSHKRRLEHTKEAEKNTESTMYNHGRIAYSSFACGLLTGVAQAAAFNPYDRALYLAIKERRNFLSWINWKSPYNGFLQSLSGRVLSGGLYFPLEHLFLDIIDCENTPLRNFLAGTMAGAVNAVVLNPLTAVKYKTWGRDVNLGMWTEAKIMLRKAGVRPFLNGLKPTLYRDIAFGGCHTWLRLQIQISFDLPPHQHWMANFVSAALATVVSGPFNYVRNMQYATPSKKQALPTWPVLQELIAECVAKPTQSERIRHLAHRLRIGWGTARVALGMSFGHVVYDWLDYISHKTLT